MKTTDYGNYGKCAVFERAGVKVMVTLDIGPRIIWFGDDKTNFLNEDRARNVSKGGDYFDHEYGAGTTWYLYGGHRVWKSPEDLETYTPDNFPVECECDDHGGRFSCRVANRLDYALELELDSDGVLTVVNEVANKAVQRSLAVWGLTVVAKGGTLVLPLNDPTDELNPVFNLVSWPYNDPEDPRLFVGRKKLALRQTDKEEAIKVGTFSRKGRAYYVLGDKAMKWECVPEEGEYGDFGCNFETYTNSHILEVEWLSRKFNLAVGEKARMTESWSLVPAASVAELTDEALSAFE